MNIALKYLTALLGLWLIVEVSVFPASAAHWIAFATAIALTTVALGDAALTGIRRRLVAASTATATALLSGFLIIRVTRVRRRLGRLADGDRRRRDRGARALRTRPARPRSPRHLRRDGQRAP